MVRHDPPRDDASAWTGAQGWNPEGAPRSPEDSTAKTTRTDDDDQFPEILSPADRERVAQTLPELLAIDDDLHSMDQELRDFARPLSAEDTLAGVAAIEMIDRRIESLRSILLARFHREGIPQKYGARSTTALLRERFKLSSREAGRRDRLARGLGARVALDGTPLGPEYPQLADALAEASVSADQVDAITSAVTALPPTLREAHRDAAEQLLLDGAHRVQVKDIPALGRRIIDHVDPDGECPREETDPEAYHVTVTPRRNGDWNLTGLLDSTTGTMLKTLIEQRIELGGDPAAGSDAATGRGGAGSHGAGNSGAGNLGVGSGAGNLGMGSGDASHPVGSGGSPGQTGTLIPDSRTPGQRRLDRFAHLITTVSRTRSAAGAAYAVVVTATAEQFARGRGEVTTQYDTPMRLEDLLRLSAGGKFYYHSTKSGTRRTEVRSENRFATPSQVALLTARDRGCTFPDCDAPPGWCDSHHIVPHSEGGATSTDNLTQVCRYHHLWHEKYGWRAVMKNGMPAWVPPPDVDWRQAPIHHSKFRAELSTEQLRLFDG